MSEASGKFVLRLSPELHAALRVQSRESSLSLNDLCVLKLGEGIVGDSHPLLTRKVLHKIEKQFPDVVGVVLFGSAARGEATEFSDIDLLLVLPSGYSISRDLYREWDRWAVAQRREFPYLKKVSPHFVSLPEESLSAGSLWFEVALDGKILLQQEETLSQVLYSLREAMASGEISRQFSHGHPYWVRKAENEE